ncbi:hypothetical protein MNF30_03825 [Mycoplasma mycoides subsp. capri]|nr:hypothetical protein MNF30_03825 [Mycoplasma mycoides subsp. capri]
MKKLLYALSTLVVSVFSTVSLVSCTKKNNNEPEQLSKLEQLKNEISSLESNVNQYNQQINKTELEKQQLLEEIQKIEQEIINLKAEENNKVKELNLLTNKKIL